VISTSHFFRKGRNCTREGGKKCHGSGKRSEKRGGKAESKRGDVDTTEKGEEERSPVIVYRSKRKGRESSAPKVKEL